jgi:MipA family protein
MITVSAFKLNPPKHASKLKLSALRCIAAACATMVSTSTFAQTTAVNSKAEGPWSVSIGVYAASSSDYEGGKKRITAFVPDFDVSYKTKDYGKFGFGSKSRGVSWTIIDEEQYSFGIAISGDAGRSEKKGTAIKPGSLRLRGLGEIKASSEFGIFGHVVVGIPLSLQIMRGSGDGKQNVKDFSFKGHGGTRIEFSSEIPVPLTSDLTLSISPSISWADAKYTQTYFGVNAVQAARTGFKRFNAKGGVKSAGISVGLNYQIDKNWSATSAVSFNQLRGSASNSPITEKKGQPSLLAGVSYSF